MTVPLGRAVALDCGLTVIGTLGLLLRAKQLGLGSQIRPLLDRLQHEINFFIAPALFQAILQQAQEADSPS